LFKTRTEKINKNVAFEDKLFIAIIVRQILVDSFEIKSNQRVERQTDVVISKEFDTL